MATNSSVFVQNLKGESGGLYVADTSAHTGSFEAIQSLEDAVAALVSSNISGTLSAVPIPAGTILYGHYSSVTLASGKVMIYNRTS